MSAIRKALRTASIIAIILGLFAMFIPVVGFFVGLPMLFFGLIIFNKTKNAKLAVERKAGNFLLKVKPIVKSKNYLAVFIALSFVLFVFGPRALRLWLGGLILWLFVMYTNLKYNEHKKSGKEMKLHLSHEKGKRTFGVGVILIVFGFIYLTLMSLIADAMFEHWEEPTIVDKVGLPIYLAFYAFPGAFLITLGFWVIRYSYRYRDHNMNKFAVIEPGQVVISKEGIKNRTLKESGN